MHHQDTSLAIEADAGEKEHPIPAVEIAFFTVLHITRSADRLGSVRESEACIFISRLFLFSSFDSISFFSFFVFHSFFPLSSSAVAAPSGPTFTM